MAREGLSRALNDSFRRAVRKKVAVSLSDIEFGANGRQFVNINIVPLDEPEPLRGLVMVVFTDVAAPAGAKSRSNPGQASSQQARVARLEQELQQAHEELRSSQEEMQTSVEELKSTNEELQSTNEELTSSKEEMQSMNEELQTVNHELQAKISELTRTSDDMKNLLNSTDIAILFLDDALNVRRFTNQMASIFKLIPGDAGRPITDIVSTLDYADLADDAHEVLRTLAIQQKQISARDGRWFMICIMPYRTQDNRIDGVVITFTDISIAKHLEAELRKAHTALEQRFTQQTAELEKERRRPGSDENTKDPT